MIFLSLINTSVGEEDNNSGEEDNNSGRKEGMFSIYFLFFCCDHFVNIFIKCNTHIFIIIFLHYVIDWRTDV